MTALDRRGVPIAAISHRGTERHQFGPHELTLSDEAPYDTNLVCLNPGHLAAFVDGRRRRVLREPIRRRDLVLGDEPDPTGRAKHDPISGRALGNEQLRQGRDRGSRDPRAHFAGADGGSHGDRSERVAELGLPEGFTFLFVFDFWSEERKNPAAVIKAFTRAFAPGEGPTLVVKSIHGDSKARELGRLRAMVENREDVVVRDGYVSAVERRLVLRRVRLLRLAPPQRGSGPHDGRGDGARQACDRDRVLGEPRVHGRGEQLPRALRPRRRPVELVGVWARARRGRSRTSMRRRELMRRAWEHPTRRRALGKQAQSELLERFSPRRTADFARGRLEELRESGAIAARTTGYDARPAILDTSLAMAGDLGASLTEGHGTSSLVRRFVRRTLWPYLRERQRVDASVLQAVISLERSVQSLERRVLELEGLAKSATDTATRPP